MKAETHAFREAFIVGRSDGFSLLSDDPESRSAVAMPFLAQKYDNQHLCLFVFENESAAEKEKSLLPPAMKTVIKKISVAQVRAFNGHCGFPVLVFLRDRDGVFAPL
jgi:hypothetical protein